MRTLDEAMDQFAYHPATAETAPKHNEVRDLFRLMLPKLWAAVPDGPEKTLAIRKLQEAQMYANLAVALTAPADTGPTRGVFRELPRPVVAEREAAEEPPIETMLSGHNHVESSVCTVICPRFGGREAGLPPAPMPQSCQCGGTTLGPFEKRYNEGNKLHYARSMGRNCAYL